MIDSLNFKEYFNNTCNSFAEFIILEFSVKRRHVGTEYQLDELEAKFLSQLADGVNTGYYDFDKKQITGEGWKAPIKPGSPYNGKEFGVKGKPIFYYDWDATTNTPKLEYIKSTKGMSPVTKPLALALNQFFKNLALKDDREYDFMKITVGKTKPIGTYYVRYKTYLKELREKMAEYHMPTHISEDDAEKIISPETILLSKEPDKNKQLQDWAKNPYGKNVGINLFYKHRMANANKDVAKFISSQKIMRDGKEYDLITDSAIKAFNLIYEKHKNKIIDMKINTEELKIHGIQAILTKSNHPITSKLDPVRSPPDVPEFIVVDKGDTPLKVGQTLTPAQYDEALKSYGKGFKIESTNEYDHFKKYEIVYPSIRIGWAKQAMLEYIFRESQVQNQSDDDSRHDYAGRDSMDSQHVNKLSDLSMTASKYDNVNIDMMNAFQLQSMLTNLLDSLGRGEDPMYINMIEKAPLPKLKELAKKFLQMAKNKNDD